MIEYILLLISNHYRARLRALVARLRALVARLRALVTAAQAGVQDDAEGILVLATVALVVA
jgi:hypothetical protein